MPDEPPPEPGEGAWLISTCRECDRDIKIRSSVAATDMACPYCSAPIALGANASDAKGKIRQKRRSIAGGNDARKAPSWDQAPSGPSDEDDNDINEYVEVDPNNPDGVRVRRVRRKRTFTSAEKFIRALTVGFVSVAALGGLAVLIIAMVKGTGTANQDMQTIAALPETVQSLLDDARADSEIPTVITRAEIKASEEILRGYLSANSWADKLSYVYKPERAQPRMERWYARPGVSDAAVPVGKIERHEKIVNQGIYVIKIAIETFPADYRLFALRQTRNDIKIDWEPSVGYQEMPLADFKKRKPTAPIPFRVVATAGDYYNYEFGDRDRWQCVELSYPLDESFKIFAYADQNDPELELFLTQLPKQPANVIVKLGYPEISTSADQARLTELVSESWFD